MVDKTLDTLICFIGCVYVVCAVIIIISSDNVAQLLVFWQHFLRFTNSLTERQAIIIFRGKKVGSIMQ